MAKKLRKTLPKDLPELISAAVESGDYAAVHAVLEGCEVDATDGAPKRTLLMLDICTPELARWAVERGTDVNAQDRSGETALHASASQRHIRGLSPTDLIELGADIHAQAGPSKLTALHKAASDQNVEAVKVLLAHGIDAEAQNYENLSALEYSLRLMQNIELVAMVPVVDALLTGGAQVTAKAQDFMRQAGETFEFHRSAFNPDHVDETETALLELYEKLGVEPVAARVVHNGVSPITATADTWQEQHAELWDMLVPSKGSCETVQGEVIRIAGRINDELHRNGGANWDDDYQAMAAQLGQHIASHAALDAQSIERASQVISGLPNAGEAAAELAKFAVEWVALNPQPIPLEAAPYTR